MSYIQVPAEGEKITIQNDVLNVPDCPIVPFIEGDGIGPDYLGLRPLGFLMRRLKKLMEVQKKISWFEVYAGEKAKAVYGDDCPPNFLPEETVNMIREYLVAIKGPLTTPVGKGIRSLNVSLRQQLDLYACVRPVRYFEGVPSPVKKPELVDMVIFRENTEDIYAGIEWAEGSDEVKKVIQFIENEMGVKKIRFPETSGIGVKPVSKEGTGRLVKAAIDYAIQNDRKSLTLVHKGNIMKFTEGAFRDWGYEVAKTQFGAEDLDGGPWQVIRKDGREIIVKDVIADAFLQQILSRPSEYDVIATLNLNGDYVSDALAAQVGGIGIAPGGNINYNTGMAIFEATHGTAPKYAGQDKVNPGSVILSGVLMLEYMGWNEAAQCIVKALEKTIAQKRVTYDFDRFDGKRVFVKVFRVWIGNYRKYELK